MANVRRTPYALFYLIDDPTLDLTAIVAGPGPLPDGPARVLALSLLTGKQFPLSHDEAELLRDIPAGDWVSEEEVGRGSDLDGLLRAGVVVSDSDEPGATVLREREAAFQANQWNLYAALYHFMTRWSGVWMAEGEDEATILSAKSREAARKLVAEHGRPPRPTSRSTARAKCSCGGATPRASCIALSSAGGRRVASTRAQRCLSISSTSP